MLDFRYKGKDSEKMPVYKDEKRNTWYCKFNYKNWKGESKVKLKRGFKFKKDALEWEREFLQVQQVEMDMKLKDFVEVYFKDKEGRLKERTVVSKRIMIEAKIIPYFGNMKLNTIKPSDIMKWQSEMMALGYKDTYLRMLQNQICALMNHAEKFYKLQDNPCKKVDKMGRANAKEFHFWTKEEFETFINSFSEKEEMYKIIYQVLFWTGSRIGEVLAIFYEDLDFQHNTIRINKTYYRKAKMDYITDPKTDSSNRIVTIPEFLMKELEAYTQRLYLLQGTDRIFQITHRGVQKKMKERAEKLGLTHIRVHDLRHSHVALLIEKEVQPLVIAQRVGHESINTTMNVYGHLYPNKQQHVADMLNTEAVGTTIEEKEKDVTNVIQFHTKRKIAKVGGSV